MANPGTNFDGSEPALRSRISGRDATAEGSRGRLAAWLATPAGCRLLAMERAVVQEAVRRFHGASLLWMGATPDLVDTTAQCMVRTRICAAHLASAPGFSAALADKNPGVDLVVADTAELPFGSASIDGVVLHHALDVVPDRRGTLYEAARVLKSGGRLVVAGFNPLSLWLLMKPLPAFRDLRPLSVARLGDWLTVLGLTRDTRAVYLNYRSSLPVALAGERWQTASAWVNRLQPPLGGAYVLAASKSGHRLLREAGSKRRQRGKLAPTVLPNPTRQVEPS